MALLEDDGCEAYLVGGWVRDAIMGIEGSDVDIATSSQAQHTMRLLRENGITVVPTGLAHGTVTAIIDSTPYEITTYRVDGEYSDSRHPDNVRFCASIEDDLSRRDFTINAMAFNPAVGFVDPFGGMNDIGRKTIRCVGDPGKRFAEDALRIMRALRFSAQLEFAIDPPTAASLVEHRELLGRISRERIGREFEKLVESAGAARVLLEFPQVFETILPGVDCEGEQWEASVEALGTLESAHLPTRLATLLLGAGNANGAEHGGSGAGQALPQAPLGHADVLKHLRFSHKTIAEVSTIIDASEAALGADEADIRLLMGEFGADALLRALDLKEAFAKSSERNLRGAPPATGEQLDGIRRSRAIVQSCLGEKKPYRICDLSISGKDLVDAGFDPGPEIGRMLEMLLRHVICEDCENSEEALLDLAAKLAR